MVFLLFASSVSANVCIPDEGNKLRVTNVEGNDTLNVRKGWNTKSQVLFGLNPTDQNIEYINHAYKNDECLELCKSYLRGADALENIIESQCRKKNQIWYNIVDPSDRIGWASAKFLTEYQAKPSSEDRSISDSAGNKYLSVDEAIVSNDLEIIRKALTDADGRTYKSVDEAIASNDETVKQAVLSELKEKVTQLIDELLSTSGSISMKRSTSDTSKPSKTTDNSMKCSAENPQICTDAEMCVNGFYAGGWITSGDSAGYFREATSRGLTCKNTDAQSELAEAGKINEGGKVVLTVTEARSVYQEFRVEDDFENFKHFASNIRCEYKLKVTNNTKFKVVLGHIQLRTSIAENHVSDINHTAFSGRGKMLKPGESKFLEPNLLMRIRARTSQQTANPADYDLIEKLKNEFGCERYNGNVFLHEGRDPYFIKFEPDAKISQPSSWKYVVGSSNGVEAIDRPVRFY